LEAELADLRARRDITSLTREEFEILATETATSLIKTAQAREARAIAAAERALAEAQRTAKTLTESAELKARTALQSAESRGRKYIETAEQEAKEAIEKATRAAQELLDSKHREASTITSSAKREAERVISEASADIANFKSWLTEAISESERLHKMQAQALAAAEEGIKHTRAKLSTAFERLTTLGNAVDSALDSNHRPKEKEFTSPTAAAAKSTAEKATEKPVRKPASKTAPSTAKKSTSTTRKSVGRPPKRK
jgi:vacuolar-type H+-ATPase subunit H